MGWSYISQHLTLAQDWFIVIAQGLMIVLVQAIGPWLYNSSAKSDQLHVGGIDTVEVTQRFNAQCGVFNASLLSQTSSSNVVSLKLLCLRHSLITIYND